MNEIYVKLLYECVGFDWDDGNINKNWLKHKVSAAEAEQIFFNHPLIIQSDRMHSKKEKRFYALGKTDSRRALFIAFSVRKNLVRVISARDMNRKERMVYSNE